MKLESSIKGLMREYWLYGDAFPFDEVPAAKEAKGIVFDNDHVIRHSRYKDVRRRPFEPHYNAFLAGWKQGIDDLLVDGDLESPCPYTEGSPAARAWGDGWGQGRCEP